jgi:hypothetical protein
VLGCLFTNKSWWLLCQRVRPVFAPNSRHTARAMSVVKQGSMRLSTLATMALPASSIACAAQCVHSAASAWAAHLPYMNREPSSAFPVRLLPHVASFGLCLCYPSLATLPAGTARDHLSAWARYQVCGSLCTILQSDLCWQRRAIHLADHCTWRNLEMIIQLPAVCLEKRLGSTTPFIPKEQTSFEEQYVQNFRTNHFEDEKQGQP